MNLTLDKFFLQAILAVFYGLLLVTFLDVATGK